MSLDDEAIVLDRVIQWAQAQDTVRTVILTSSRANPHAHPDAFSDYDIELYVRDQSMFRTDDWLAAFWPVLIRWPLQPRLTWNEQYLTRLVLFENRVRIDFQIVLTEFLNPASFDNGFNVLVDKEGLSKQIPEPTYQEFCIRKPTEEEFLSIINEFFWDGTYVVKCLRRDELPYAKYMLDSVIRFHYFHQMVEWFIGSQHDWSVSTNKFGRYFKRLLDADTWKEVESTFAGADVEENWQAFFRMVKLFRRLAQEVAQSAGYRYPDEQDVSVSRYYQEMYEGRDR